MHFIKRACLAILFYNNTCLRNHLFGNERQKKEVLPHSLDCWFGATFFAAGGNLSLIFCGFFEADGHNFVVAFEFVVAYNHSKLLAYCSTKLQTNPTFSYLLSGRLSDMKC